MSSSYPHFEGRDALKHVVEKRARGIMEVHGTELPGHLSAGADAVRELALILMLAAVALFPFGIALKQQLLILCLLALGLIFGKVGRSAWLAWSRLERLHRVLEQERYEIEHHRSQEREELKVLYAAKGFEGPLLEQVVDVMMADGDRLLKIMLEEELGLTLEGYQHPLQQGFGAGCGALLSSALCLAAFFFFPPYGIVAASLILMGCAAAFSAKFEDNRILPAVIWNIGIGILCFGVVFFAIRWIESFQARL